MAGSDSEQWESQFRVIAAHGGSGASLVARLLRVPESLPELLPAECAAVITARTTGDGMDAALVVAAAFPPEARLAALVLSGDAPLRPPARVLAGVRLLPPDVPVIWLPYIAAWRYGPAAPSTASRRWRTAARDLVARFAEPAEVVTSAHSGRVLLPDHEGVPA